MSYHAHNLASQVVHVAAQHKQVVDATIAGTGFGAAIVSFMDMVQPLLAGALTLASLVLVMIRIWIAWKEAKAKKDESA